MAKDKAGVTWEAVGVAIREIVVDLLVFGGSVAFCLGAWWAFPGYAMMICGGYAVMAGAWLHSFRGAGS